MPLKYACMECTLHLPLVGSMYWYYGTVSGITVPLVLVQYGTGLLEWAHFFLRDPNDLKCSSLIQRVFLMRLEHSDLINNLYSFS